MNTSSQTLKVTVSVSGRFHAFYLADQLHKRGHLERLITTYPRFEVKKYGIPEHKITSLLPYELIRRGWGKLPKRLQNSVDFPRWYHERFDHAAQRYIPETTYLYVGWSSFSEHGLKRAKALGAVTILERGSSHIEYQRDILREEYDRFGIEPRLPHPAIVEKEKREYELADYIAVPSGFAYRSFIEKDFPPEKIIRIPYGVDLSQFHQISKEDKCFRVIFAGGMTLRKGVHYLLKAFLELALPDSELWLIGNKNPEIEPFFNKCQGTFRYFGKVPQPTLHTYYSQCSVFAMCSIEEGLAMVQPQAMACGLPLICTTNTGGEDLIDDGKEGFVVPIRDVEAIKDKILFLYKNQDICYEMGQAAKRKVQSGLTWDDYGERVISKYDGLIYPTGIEHK